MILSISLGIGCPTLKAGVELLRWLWGAVAHPSEHQQLKQGILGLFLRAILGLWVF